MSNKSPWAIAAAGALVAVFGPPLADVAVPDKTTIVVCGGIVEGPCPPERQRRPDTVYLRSSPGDDRAGQRVLDEASDAAPLMKWGLRALGLVGVLGGLALGLRRRRI